MSVVVDVSEDGTVHLRLAATPEKLELELAPHRPIPPGRFRKMIDDVCARRYSLLDELVFGPIEDWNTSLIEDFSNRTSHTR